VIRPVPEIVLWAMVLMPSNEYSPEERSLLLDVARRSIQHGLKQGGALIVDLDDYPEHLTQERACFVTLNLPG
jgi:uncharacterized protein